MKSFHILLGICLASAAFSSLSEETIRCGLEVTSSPNGATVWVDHVNRGVTPLNLPDLPAGAHLLRVTSSGYQDSFATVSLTPGAVRRVSCSLERETGLLLLITEPAGCEVAENGISLGTSPLFVNSLPSGEHRLTISSPGYQTKEVDLKLDGRTPLRKEVSLLSDSGTLNLTSDPAGAEVLVNGIARGKNPCKLDRIPGGETTLELRASGFQSHSRSLSLAAGEVQSAHITLRPLPGTLRVVSIPDHARVYMDNQFKGTAPCDLLKIQPGKYRIRVELPGHDPLVRDVTVAKGASATEEFRLQGNTGRIEVMTAPPSAMILLDGKKRGLTLSRNSKNRSVSDPFSLDDVLEGEHTIELVRKGFKSVKKKITIVRGKTLPIQVKLVREFIPDYEVTTTRSYYTGVLEFKNEEGIRLEVREGISQTIPMKDVKKHGYLKAVE